MLDDVFWNPGPAVDNSPLSPDWILSLYLRDLRGVYFYYFFTLTLLFNLIIGTYGPSEGAVRDYHDLPISDEVEKPLQPARPVSIVKVKL